MPLFKLPNPSTSHIQSELIITHLSNFGNLKHSQNSCQIFEFSSKSLKKYKFFASLSLVISRLTNLNTMQSFLCLFSINIMFRIYVVLNYNSFCFFSLFHWWREIMLQIVLGKKELQLLSRVRRNKYPKKTIFCIHLNMNKMCKLRFLHNYFIIYRSHLSLLASFNIDVSSRGHNFMIGLKTFIIFIIYNNFF